LSAKKAGPPGRRPKVPTDKHKSHHNKAKDSRRVYRGDMKKKKDSVQEGEMAGKTVRNSKKKKAHEGERAIRVHNKPERDSNMGEG